MSEFIVSYENGDYILKRAIQADWYDLDDGENLHFFIRKNVSEEAWVASYSRGVWHSVELKGTGSVESQN